jgi:glycosyltransferase involved in cell wall biosynthesis
MAPGYVSDTDLAATMAGAQALVFPSLYEGFGLPALDAMALGIPVISTNRAYLPEVCGDGALMIDPMSIDDMAEKIELVATRPDLRKELAQRGMRNAQRFSWEKTAEITLRVYEEVRANEKVNGATAQ